MSGAVQVVSAGADGLVKLWGVRSSECTATFDEHDGKVWALTVAGEQDAVLATGGADARVNIWRDCTAEDEAAAVTTRTQAVVKAQELSNALKVDFLPDPCSSNLCACLLQAVLSGPANSAWPSLCALC